MTKLKENIIAEFKNGRIEHYDTLKEASIATNLSVNSIKARCNNGSGAKSKDGIIFKWADEHTKKSKQAKRNRHKGNNLELEIVKALKAIGFEGCVSSRSQNKLADADKIDIIDMNNELPVNIQSKYLQNTPSYFAIRDACSDKSKPFTLVWKKSGSNGCKSPGTVCMVPFNFFIELLRLYKQQNDKNSM